MIILLYFNYKYVIFSNQKMEIYFKETLKQWCKCRVQHWGHKQRHCVKQALWFWSSILYGWDEQTNVSVLPETCTHYDVHVLWCEQTHVCRRSHIKNNSTGSKTNSFENRIPSSDVKTNMFDLVSLLIVLIFLID